MATIDGWTGAPERSRSIGSLWDGMFHTARREKAQLARSPGQSDTTASAGFATHSTRRMGGPDWTPSFIASEVDSE